MDKFSLFLVMFLVMMSNSATAKIITSPIEYTFNKTVMEGYVAYDDSIQKPMPGILIVHDWMGLGQFTKDKALALANQGMVAFAVDIYGKNVRPQNSEEAAKLATQYKEDRQLLRAHIGAAYDKLVTMNDVDPKKILVMGYCFGGTTALELARSGANLIGTAIFHGGISTPTPLDAKNIKGEVLIMHGADDPNVPPAEVKAFKAEMKNAKIKMDFIAYRGAVHAFTNPAAGNDNSKGAAYNAEADKKSWIDFQNFLKKVLK